MSSAFGRRLLIVTALEIAVVVGAVVAAAMLFVLGAYLNALRGDMQTMLERTVEAIASSPPSASARETGIDAATRYLRRNVVVLLVDVDRRVDVYAPLDRSAQPVIDVRPRGDIGGEPRATGLRARLVLGLATAYGLQLIRSHVRTIDVIVKPNEPALVATVTAYIPAMAVALALVALIAIVLARVLTHQVLRPLVDVTKALERFAAGDLTPQPIVADERQQLGTLALAYNGAIAQVEYAFGERDRANAAMRQFIADAGHQLRTPLTVVRGFIAVLRKGELRTPADRERILETMNRQSQIMGAMIDKLMLLERWEDEGGGAASERIDVARLVSDVVSPIAESHPLRTVRVAAPDVGLAPIDPGDLTHAVTNLVDNALKYTHGAVDVSVVREGARIVIDIVDEGPGMSVDEARHAFDRFFRGARRDIDGSGLGLAIARRAVERAGGTLTLDSDPKRGSRFTIRLPSDVPVAVR